MDTLEIFVAADVGGYFFRNIHMYWMGVSVDANSLQRKGVRLSVPSLYYGESLN